MSSNILCEMHGLSEGEADMSALAGIIVLSVDEPAARCAGRNGFAMNAPRNGGALVKQGIGGRASSLTVHAGPALFPRNHTRQHADVRMKCRARRAALITKDRCASMWGLISMSRHAARPILSPARANPWRGCSSPDQLRGVDRRDDEIDALRSVLPA